jgi:hypothetical protein
MEADKNRTAKPLAWTLSCLNSKDQKDLLIKTENEVLVLLVNKTKDEYSEYLTAVLAGTIDGTYTGFNPDDLNQTPINPKKMS